MIMPSRWFSGGKGLDDFRASMLNDDRLRLIHDYPEATDCFAGVQIKGGVCYFRWERANNGLCRVTSHLGGKIISSIERPLLEDNNDTFIRYNEAISIIEKVNSLNEPSIKSMISARKPFGLSTTYRGKVNQFEGSVSLYQNGGIAYIDKSDISINIELIDYYKVFIPPLGSGSDSFPHPILGKPLVASPNSVCTETYIIAGSYNNKEEAENLASYLSTKFLRFLVLQNKPSQHATSKTYKFVPLQNFTSTSDIDWSQSIADIDRQLYAKYGLSEEEVAFIEGMIKVMG